jgi:hypothetical protein
VKGLPLIEGAWGHVEQVVAKISAKARSVLEPNFDYAPMGWHGVAWGLGGAWGRMRMDLQPTAHRTPGARSQEPGARREVEVLPQDQDQGGLWFGLGGRSLLALAYLATKTRKGRRKCVSRCPAGSWLLPTPCSPLSLHPPRPPSPSPFSPSPPLLPPRARAGWGASPRPGRIPPLLVQILPI